MADVLSATLQTTCISIARNFSSFKASFIDKIYICDSTSSRVTGEKLCFQNPVHGSVNVSVDML